MKARIITVASSGKEIQMTSKPISRKIISIVTAALTMAVMCGLPAFAYAADTGVSKEETVYVVTNSTGEQQDVIVSDHLVNKGKVKTISDETTLSDIENVKGEETFKQNGDALTWDAGGNSIYYQGKTTEEVPVTMDVTYRLDDKVVSGPELQGKSGKVEIRIHYENTATYEGSTVPFIVMTGLIVTDDSFKNIKISKGKVIDDGEKLLVVGMAAPGLAQTLGIGESELGIGSTVTITGDAKKFAVEDMMTIVTNAFIEDIDSDGIDMDYDDEIDALNKGAKALVDGSEMLNKGTQSAYRGVAGSKGEMGLVDALKYIASYLKTVQSNMSDLVAGIQGIHDNSSLLTDELGTIKEGLDNGSAKMSGAADVLEGSSESLGAGIKSIHNNADTASDDLKEVIGVMEKHKSVIIAGLMADGYTQEQAAALITKLYTAQAIDEGIAKSTSESSDLGQAAGTLSGAASDLQTNASQLQGAASGLGEYDPSKGEKQTTIIGGYTVINAYLSTIADTISSSMNNSNAGKLNKLVSGAEDLEDGLQKISEGSRDLAKGMSRLYSEGIKKIVDMYNDDLKGTLDSVDGMLDAGRGYKTFTKLPADMDGNVKFIYKTDMTN